MARKTDVERLQDMEKKIEQTKAKKQQLESRLKERKRKARTKRLIEVGAIFEKYFEIQGEVEAEKIALGMAKRVKEEKENLLRTEINHRGEEEDGKQ